MPMIDVAPSVGSLGIGDLAPDLLLPDHEAEWVSFSSLWSAQPLLLVFLRHLECPHCRAYVMELAEEYQAIADAGAHVALVSLGSSQDAAHFKQQKHVPFPILADPDRQSYQAYGLGTTNLIEQISPKAIKHYLDDMRVGGGKGISLHQNMLQLGGTFLIDTGGIIRYLYRSTVIANRPDIDTLLESMLVYSYAHSSTLSAHQLTYRDCHLPRRAKTRSPFRG